MDNHKFDNHKFTNHKFDNHKFDKNKQAAQLLLLLKVLHTVDRINPVPILSLHICNIINHFRLLLLAVAMY